MRQGRLSPREKDLRDLRILDLRVIDGLSENAIAARMGMTRKAVLGIVHRVRADDSAYSGEDVAHAYDVGGGLLSADWHWSHCEGGRA